MSISMCQNQPHPNVEASIDKGYRDGFGHWHDTSDETLQAIVYAMGGDTAGPDSEPDVLVVRLGESLEIDGPADLRLEDGSSQRIESRLPADLPMGYHLLTNLASQHKTHLIVAPGECHLDPTMRSWGWATQLYAVRSENSWGIGDFSDLSVLAEFSKQVGADVIQVNPLGATSPGLSQIDSPYFPTSRRFINPLYIDVSKLAEEMRADVSGFAEAARALNANRLINRDEVYKQKFSAFEQLFGSFDSDDGYVEFLSECDRSLGCGTLHSFAVFCVIAELYGGDYRTWPEEFRSTASDAVKQFAAEHERRVTFFKWLQWHADRQLKDAASRIDIANDLPIGFDPGGFDAWQWQDVISSGATIGSPPDAFNSEGQNWAIPPFIPHRLRAAGYRPFIETIRANLRHAKGLRIDHVMGLYRLFWIPNNMSAADGTYVNYQHDEMLAILAIESQRAGAWIAGEDLGTVPEGMRERMDRMNILSHRLAIFEQASPDEYPQKTLAAISTHDLPTLAGLWDGTDIQSVRDIGRQANEEDYEYMLDCLRRMTSSSPDESAQEVIRRAYALFQTAPSAIVLASLEDALCVHERPNIPGTIDEWPNWRISLPKSLEQIVEDAGVTEFAHAIAR